MPVRVRTLYMISIRELKGRVLSKNGWYGGEGVWRTYLICMALVGVEDKVTVYRG